MLAKQLTIGAALLLVGSSALPQPERRQTTYSDSNTTTFNGTTYSLVEVGARNTLVRQDLYERRRYRLADT